MTERELIEGVIRGDRNAVGMLVREYQNKVIKTAYYFTNNMEDAEDLSQEIFLEIIHSLPAFKGLSSLSTWIYRITVNRSLNQLKRNKRKHIFVNISHYFRITRANRKETGIEPFSVMNDLEVRENKALLHSALHKLPERQRTAFVLHKFEDLPYQQIAEVMSVSVSSVESLIHRAKINLQKMLVHHFSNQAKK